MGLKSYKELEVWKRAMAFVTKVYGVTASFPRAEIYGLTSQMRRSAVSVPSNIAEGATRNSTKEFIRFLYVALGSASEIAVQLQIACNLKYLPEDPFVVLSEEREEISRMLSGLIRSVGRRPRH